MSFADSVTNELEFVPEPLDTEVCDAAHSFLYFVEECAQPDTEVCAAADTFLCFVAECARPVVVSKRDTRASVEICKKHRAQFSAS
jgi:hypothetical protein